MLKNNKKTLILTSTIILLPILIGLLFWDKFPDTMATHFGTNNQANGYSSKFFAIVGIPSILFVIQLLCAIVVAKDPKRKNISNKIYNMILWIVPCVSIIITVSMYTYNLGRKINISFITGILVGVIFIIIGNYLPKIRQNYTIGIKLPWTLSNEENWNKTHRFAGIIWIIVGIFLTFIGIIGKANDIVLIVPILIAIIVPSIYSYILHSVKGL